MNTLSHVMFMMFVVTDAGTVAHGLRVLENYRRNPGEGFWSGVSVTPAPMEMWNVVVNHA